MDRILLTAFVALILLPATGAGFQSQPSPAPTPIGTPQAQAPGLNSCPEPGRAQIVEEISKYTAKASKAYETMWGLFHIAILVVCIIIIRHTATVTQGARFMRCFMSSYAVTACFYAGAVLMPYFLAYIANKTSTDCPVPLNALESSLLKLREIDYMWNAIDSFLSLFSSFFLFMGWHLLKRYPDESIAREFYTALNMIFAAIVGPLLVGVLLISQPEIQTKPKGVVFLLVDTLVAGTAVCLFGWELWRKMRPVRLNRKRSGLQAFMQKYWHLLSLPIPICYLLWGAAQPAYVYFHDKELSHPYFGSLLVLKLLAGISVVIAASAALKERSEFESDVGVQKR